MENTKGPLGCRSEKVGGWKNAGYKRFGFLSYVFGWRGRKVGGWKTLLFGWRKKREDGKCNLYKLIIMFLLYDIKEIDIFTLIK